MEMYELREMLDQVGDGLQGLLRRRLVQWVSKTFS